MGIQMKVSVQTAGDTEVFDEDNVEIEDDIRLESRPNVSVDVSGSGRERSITVDFGSSADPRDIEQVFDAIDDIVNRGLLLSRRTISNASVRCTPRGSSPRGR
jgi:hypothetical protein